MRNLLLSRKTSDFDKIFDELFNRSWLLQHDYTFSGLLCREIKKEDKSVNLELDLPGFDKTDLKVRVVNDKLVVSGKRESDGRELYYEKFIIGYLINNAKLKNGVLTINVKPKEFDKELEIKIED